MSNLEQHVRSIPGTSVTVGSEGAISIRDDGAVIRILTAEQARELSNVLGKAADHSEGKLIGDGV